MAWTAWCNPWGKCRCHFSKCSLRWIQRSLRQGQFCCRVDFGWFGCTMTMMLWLCLCHLSSNFPVLLHCQGMGMGMPGQPQSTARNMGMPGMMQLSTKCPQHPFKAGCFLMQDAMTYSGLGQIVHSGCWAETGRAGGIVCEASHCKRV